MKILIKVKTLIKKIRDALSTKISFDDLNKMKNIYLYAGDVPRDDKYKKFIGLSINQSNINHIKHDMNDRILLPDKSVDIFQSEDVFEHIELKNLLIIINEIYRVLKPGGIFRLSLPDYGCDILYDRSDKDENGKLLFDSGGGGDFINGKVLNGGHVWFPKYESVKTLLEKTLFKNIKYLHYYDESGKGFTSEIDYSIGYVQRTPDNDERVKNPYRPMSIVVDCKK